MTQTLDERLHLLDAGTGGSILCFDLAHADGQMGADMLARNYPAVAEALRSRHGNMHYMLALLPGEHIEGSNPVVMLVDRAALPEAITEIYRRAKQFADPFSVVIAPRSAQIKELFDMLDKATAVTP